MITVNQIKAARALINWTQKDLSTKSGISLAAINKLERELVSPRQFTLNTLQQTFEREGVEFTAGPGVRMTEEIFSIQVLDKGNVHLKLLNDIDNTLKDTQGKKEFLLCGLDNRRLKDWRDKIDKQQMTFQEHGISFRALVCEGDTMFLPYVDVQKTYRWIPKALFTQMLYYVYDNKYAFMLLCFGGHRCALLSLKIK